MADRRYRCGGPLVVAVATFLAAGLLGPASAGAADTATLTGTVRNGSADNAPEPAIGVTLHVYEAEAEVTTRSASTDASGGFEFADLDTGSGITYSVSADYQAVTYASEAVTPAPGEAKVLDLTIYEASDSTADLRIREWLIWIDREGDSVAVQHDLTVENSGTTTFAGDEDLGDGQKAVLRLPLPPGAANFQYMGLFLECCAVVRDTTFLHTTPVPPGISSGTVRVNADDIERLELEAQLPADGVRLFVPSDAKVTAPSTFEPTGTVEDMGVTYQVLAATGMARGEKVSITVEGLASDDGLSRLWLVPAGALLAVGASAFLIVRRRRAASGPARKSERPPPKKARAAPSPEERRERDLIIDEIAALDLAFENGAIEEETYRRVREARMAELVERHGHASAEA